MTATLIAALGASNLLRKHDIVVYAIMLYMVIILFWWWEPSRFLIPAYPILAIMFVSGLRDITVRRSVTANRLGRAFLAGLFATSIVGGLAVDSTRLVAVWKYHHWAGPAGASYWNDTKSALDWIRANTSPGTRCISPLCEAVYLFTGRRSMELPLTVDAMEHMFRDMPGDTIVLAIWRANCLSATKEEYAFSGIRNVVRRSPQLLSRVWHSPDEQVEVYRISGGPKCGEEGR
jgi:hypothetical protein